MGRGAEQLGVAPGSLGAVLQLAERLLIAHGDRGGPLRWCLPIALADTGAVACWAVYKLEGSLRATCHMRGCRMLALVWVWQHLVTMPLLEETPLPGQTRQEHPSKLACPNWSTVLSSWHLVCTAPTTPRALFVRVY